MLKRWLGMLFLFRAGLYTCGKPRNSTRRYTNEHEHTDSAPRLLNARPAASKWLLLLNCINDWRSITTNFTIGTLHSIWCQFWVTVGLARLSLQKNMFTLETSRYIGYFKHRLHMHHETEASTSYTSNSCALPMVRPMAHHPLRTAPMHLPQSRYP